MLGAVLRCADSRCALCCAAGEQCALPEGGGRGGVEQLCFGEGAAQSEKCSAEWEGVVCAAALHTCVHYLFCLLHCRKMKQQCGVASKMEKGKGVRWKNRL